MCGIAGMIGRQAKHHEVAVRRMLDAMQYRGPDGCGIWTSPSGQCVLGHRRLAILDLSDSAAQPMSDEDRHVLTYNGECYNYADLKSTFGARAAEFRSSGDTEVVLKMLIRDGRSALPKLNAMFALAYWEEATGQLLLARDRFGQKPVYWIKLDQGLLFASEVRALLASGLVSRTLSPSGLTSFLCQGAVQGPGTIVQDVMLLPRGSTLTARINGTLDIESFWQPNTDKQACGSIELRERFQSAVARHLVSDVPIGVFLSGGVDSSAIAAAAVRSTNSSVTSLSVVFPDQPSYSEAIHARRMAQHAGTNHIEMPVGNRDALELVNEAVSRMDQPTLDGVNTYIVSKAARDAGLTVALSGLGADELFGGYTSFSDVPRMHRATRVLDALRTRKLLDRVASLHHWVGRRQAKLRDLLASRECFVAQYLTRRRALPSQQVNALLGTADTSKWLGGISNNVAKELRKLTSGLAPVDKVTQLELAIYMGQILLRDTDVFGMAHSLEIRVPMLDARFSETVMQLPAEVRWPRLGRRKWKLIEALGDWLPEENWKRPKQGFGLPWDDWLCGPLRDSITNGLRELSVCCEMFEQSEINRLWHRYQQSPQKMGWCWPWMLYVASIFIQQHGLSLCRSEPPAQIMRRVA